MSWTDYASAPARGTRICAAAEVADGVTSLAVAGSSGTLPLLLVRTDAGLRAYVNACPHQFLPLDYRGPHILTAAGDALMCTAHGARFDVETGAPLTGADCALDAVPILEED